MTDGTGLRHLAHMLALHPNLATGLFLPALTMSVLFFLMSDVVALRLGLYAIATGLVFAVAAARQMARDGIDFSRIPNQRTDHDPETRDLARADQGRHARARPRRVRRGLHRRQLGNLVRLALICAVVGLASATGAHLIGRHALRERERRP